MRLTHFGLDHPLDARRFFAPSALSRARQTLCLAPHPLPLRPAPFWPGLGLASQRLL